MIDVFDEIAKLLAAGSRASDPSVRAVYTAEARMRLESARARLINLSALADAAEAELTRLARAAEEGGE